MINKKIKIVLLSVIVLVMLGLPGLGTNQNALPDQGVADQLNPNKTPEKSYTYDSNQLEYDGSNVGLYMESEAQTSEVATEAMWDPTDGTYTRYETIQYPWLMELPTSMEGTSWTLWGGQVTISDMSSTDNFVPNNGQATHFEASTSEWNYPLGAYSYTDNYWGSTAGVDIFQTDTQTYMTGAGHTIDGAYVVSNSEDFSTVGDGVGYIELQSARRAHTFYPSDSKTSPSSVVVNQGPLSSPYTPFNCYWETLGNTGSTLANDYYSANREGDTTTIVYKGSATDWAWGNTQGGVTAYKTEDFANNQFITHVERATYYSLYQSQYKSSTNGDWQAHVHASWDITQVYETQFSMWFYYKKTNDGPTNALYSANIDFTEIGNLANGGHDDSANGVTATSSVSGNIVYEIYKQGGTSALASDSKSFASDASGAISDTACDVAGNSFGGVLTDTAGAWYEYRITVYIELRTIGTVDKLGNVVAQGYTGTTSVSVPYTTYNDGVEVLLSDPAIDIYETAKIDDPNKDYIEISTTSATVDWDQRTIPAGNTVQLSYGYQIPDELYGYDGASGSLSNANFRTRLIVHKGTSTYEFIQDAQQNFGQVRGYLGAYGYGCAKFVWDMNTTVQAALNRSDSIEIKVGIVIYPGFELSWDVYGANAARVYFNNIDFTVTTVPSAEALNVDLVFYGNLDSTPTEIARIPFADDGTLPTASVSFDNTSAISASYWSADNQGFVFEADSPISLTYTATFIAEFRYWDTIVHIKATNDTIYYELNRTIAVPKPYSYGQSYAVDGYTVALSGAKWDQYWNDNFNISFIVPKYYIGSEDYWNLSWGFDNNRPTVPNTRKAAVENYIDWDPASTIWLEEYPDGGLYSADANFDKTAIQAAHIDNQLFRVYTSSTSGQGPLGTGIDEMDWDLLFYAPNDLNNIIIDDDTGFSPDSATDEAYYNHYFYSEPEFDYVYVQVEKARNLQAVDSNVYVQYQWYAPGSSTAENTGVDSTITASAGTIDSSSSTQQFQVSNTDPKGPNWLAYGVVFVDNVFNTTGSRLSGQAYLAGTYRGGLKYTTFTVKGKSQLTDLQITNTIANYQSQNSTDSTYYFNSSAHNLLSSDPSNMLKISINWTDYSGDSINGSVYITINHYNYRDEFNNIVPKLETDFANVPMTYVGNGIYEIWVDPPTMDNVGGNVTRGYHEFNITCNDPNYDPIVYTGNFSLSVDTVLEIQKPGHYFVDSVGRHHYDDSDCIADSPYTISAKYFINKTGTEELINNELGSYYEGNVFMTYDLVAIHQVSDFSLTIKRGDADWDLFVNETYFAKTYSYNQENNPYLLLPNATMGWPTRGYMNNTRGDGLFYATFKWPKWGVVGDYNNGSLTEYDSQTDQPRILEYNISVYVRVNRTYVNETFQPNDVEREDGEGVQDVAVFDYTEAVKVREESILVKLNSFESGNFTRIMLLNNESLDGETYKMGTYNPDEAHINAYDGTYSPEYIIRNYQNNLTYNSNNASHPNAFRIRAILNCSKVNSLDEGQYRASWWNDTGIFYPMGPLNASNDMYTEANITWMGDTNMTLYGWNSTDIPMSPSSVMWETQVNSSGQPFNATGVTYVSPWLKWSDKPAGTYTLYVKARKKGFVSYTVSITLEIIEAPTVALNGNKSNPAIPADEYRLDEEYRLNVTTPTGIPVAFDVNFTDITNFNTLGVTAPVTSADIRCIADDNSYTWNNATGTHEDPVIRSSWNFKNLGNGLYRINVTYTDKQISNNNGEAVILSFELMQENYTSAKFSVMINITKRDTKFIILDSVAEDYYYYYPRLSGAAAVSGLYEPIEYGITHIKFTLALLDVDGGNEPIDINTLDSLAVPKDYMRLWQKINISEPYAETYSSFYKIEKFTNSSGQVVYNITFSTEQAPGNYSLQLRLKNLLNYYDTTIDFNATIKQGQAAVKLLPSETRDSVPFYRVSNDEVKDSYLPYYTLVFYDIHHNNTDNEPITFGKSLLLDVSSNFTNPYRTVARYNELQTYGSNVDARFIDHPVGDQKSIMYILDISGFETQIVDGQYQPFQVNLTFDRIYFESQTYTINVTITNATARIFLSGYDSEHNEEVYVRQLDRSSPRDTDTLGTGGSYYQSIIKNITTGEMIDITSFDQDIYYGMLVQIQFGYFAYGTDAKENILYDTNNTLQLNIQGQTDGVTVRTLTSPPYGMIYFLATPTAGDYATLSYNFTVSMKNYEPRTYYMIFHVIPHPTSALKTKSVDTVKYTEEVKWEVIYTDTADEDILLTEHINIRSAMVYPYGDESKGVASGGSGTYVFADGQSCVFSVDMLAPGLYEITFDTSTLNVRDEPYYINMTIGKEHYVSQQIYGDGLDLPYFKIEPIELQADVWLTLTDVAPDITTDPMPMIYVDPTVYSSIYVWVRVYVTLNDGDGGYKELDVVDNIQIIANISDEQNRDPDTNLPELLWQQNITYDKTYQLWRANVSLTHQQSAVELDPIELTGVNSLTIQINSTNQNYKSLTTKALFLVQRAPEVVPPWVYIVAGVAILSVVTVGGVGIKKALKLRIPYVLRKIDESIELISKDKFPTVGVMMGRNEFMINKVIEYLDICGIEWAIADKIEAEDLGDEEDEEEGTSGAPLSIEELTIELNKIESLTPDERALFIDELKRLDRKGQEEFLDSLREG